MPLPIIAPGATELIRIPRGAHSTQSVLVRFMIPARAAAVWAMSGILVDQGIAINKFAISNELDLQGNWRDEQTRDENDNSLPIAMNIGFNNIEN